MKRSELKALIREVIEQVVGEENVKNTAVQDLIQRLTLKINQTFKDGSTNVCAKKTLMLVMQELVKGGWQPSNHAVTEAGVIRNKMPTYVHVDAKVKEATNIDGFEQDYIEGVEEGTYNGAVYKRITK